MVRSVESCGAGKSWNSCCALSRRMRRFSWPQSYPLQHGNSGDSHRPPAKKNILKMLVLFDLRALKSTILWGVRQCTLVEVY
jgi:hypothetical protein